MEPNQAGESRRKLKGHLQTSLGQRGPKAESSRGRCMSQRDALRCQRDQRCLRCQRDALSQRDEAGDPEGLKAGDNKIKGEPADVSWQEIEPNLRMKQGRDAPQLGGLG